MPLETTNEREFTRIGQGMAVSIGLHPWLRFVFIGVHSWFGNFWLRLCRAGSIRG